MRKFNGFCYCTRPGVGNENVIIKWEREGGMEFMERMSEDTGIIKWDLLIWVFSTATSINHRFFCHTV